MNADQLREIRERHMSDEQRMVFTQSLPSFMGIPGFRPTDHSDRAALLAEVDRLKGLCGLALDALVSADGDFSHPALLTELREAGI